MQNAFPAESFHIVAGCESLIFYSFFLILGEADEDAFGSFFNAIVLSSRGLRGVKPRTSWIVISQSDACQDNARGASPPAFDSVDGGR